MSKSYFLWTIKSVRVALFTATNGNLNKFVFLLRKGVYPYEYMDSWERFNETSLPPKNVFIVN